MLTSKTSYYKNILGISLKGKIPQKEESFYFLCSKEDFENNKEFVVKICAAVQKSTSNVVVHSVKDIPPQYKGAVFCFGEVAEKAEWSSKRFSAFSKLKEVQKEKALFWEELKIFKR